MCVCESKEGKPEPLSHIASSEFDRLNGAYPRIVAKSPKDAPAKGLPS